MKCKFVPGDRVVCVDASLPPGDQWDGDALVEGAVYTVESVFVDDEGQAAVSLLEARRDAESLSENDNEAGYFARRFRPAEDIEQFRRIVANAPRDLVQA
jgi:hypothetical protein